ncbi:MAG TPA: hypothetical protein VF789_14770 [Thermoanaerobaculia bacterium]
MAERTRGAAKKASKKPARKAAKKATETRQTFRLRPSDLEALQVAVIFVERSGNARTRAGAIFNDNGNLVEECRFVGNRSQDIPLQAGANFQLAFRVRGSVGDRWGFDVVSKMTGQSLGFDNGTLTTATEAGQIDFVAR